MSRRRPWLVAYDIADPKRLRRVHTFLKAQGMPVQYSVFLVYATTAELDELLAGLAERIHPGRDDVRAYRLPAGLWYRNVGSPLLPLGLLAALEGVILGGSLEKV